MYSIIKEGSSFQHFHQSSLQYCIISSTYDRLAANHCLSRYKDGGKKNPTMTPQPPKRTPLNLHRTIPTRDKHPPTHKPAPSNPPPPRASRKTHPHRFERVRQTSAPPPRRVRGHGHGGMATIPAHNRTRAGGHTRRHTAHTGRISIAHNLADR